MPDETSSPCNSSFSTSRLSPLTCSRPDSAGGRDPLVISMALAMGYGILFATPLTLFLLPCLLMLLDDLMRLGRWLPLYRPTRRES